MLANHEDPHATDGDAGSPARLSPDDVLLLDFFDQLFAPLQLAHRTKGDLSGWRSSIGWLTKTVGHPVTLAELTRDNLVATLDHAANAGIGRDRLKAIRQHLAAIHRYAHALQLAGEYQHVPLPEVPEQPAAPAAGPAAGVLLRFYEKHFRVELAQRVALTKLQSHDRAVVHFERFAAKQWQGRTITPAAVAAFAAHVRQQGRAEATVREYRECITRVLRDFAPEVAPEKQPLVRVRRDVSTEGAPEKKPSGGPSTRDVPRDLPTPAAGSLRELFEQTFLPQRLLDVQPETIADYRRELRGLYAHAGGRDVQVAQLNDELIAGYLMTLRESGLSPQTVNRARACLLALWRFARTAQLVTSSPNVRKLKETKEVPDAWNEAELLQILAAVDRVKHPDVVGFPFADFWKAALLILYYTAMRRRSLFSIRRDDVNLTAGTIYVGGDGMKTRQGQAYRIGPDCIAAIRKIWQPQRELLLPLARRSTVPNKHFGKILHEAGIEPGRRKSLQRFHKFRRTVATLIRRRAGLSAASNLLGHGGNGEMTKRYIDTSQLEELDATQYLPPLVTVPNAASDDDADGQGGDV